MTFNIGSNKKQLIANIYILSFTAVACLRYNNTWNETYKVKIILKVNKLSHYLENSVNVRFVF